MEIKVIKDGMSRGELGEMAHTGFGELVKAVVDVAQEIMAVGGELHADMEALLTETCGAKREDLWGINLYPDKVGDEWIEFDSMINLKPRHGNRSRGVESPEIRANIVAVVTKRVHN